jgi:glycolate oxidase iron-sulfur subunit
MQTSLPADFARTPAGQRVDRELRKCVHCGFCNATCPTYRLTGDELDGPRGRIFLIKQWLETGAAGPTTLAHLDRCLLCRACETTCPSGVEYHTLLDHGRTRVAQQVPRGAATRWLRRLMVAVLPRRRLVRGLVAVARPFAPLLPAALRARLPAPPRLAAPAPRRHARRVVLMQGCVEPAVAPDTGRAAARVLDALGIEPMRLPAERCCGALPFHLDDHAGGRRLAAANVEAWYAALEAGAEAVVVPSSGCQSFIADYARLLADDPVLGAKAKRVVARVRDLSLVLEPESSRIPAGPAQSVAFQVPCSLQHALRADAGASRLLAKLGYRLAPVRDAHQCCGSAGAYSLLQPAMSASLRSLKLAALAESGADCAVTANVGCRAQLSTPGRPVRHWIELVAERFGPST